MRSSLFIDLLGFYYTYGIIVKNVSEVSVAYSAYILEQIAVILRLTLMVTLCADWTNEQLYVLIGAYLFGIFISLRKLIILRSGFSKERRVLPELDKSISTGISLIGQAVLNSFLLCFGHIGQLAEVDVTYDRAVKSYRYFIRRMIIVSVTPGLFNCNIAFCLITERLHEICHVSLTFDRNVLGDKCTVGVVYMKINIRCKNRSCTHTDVYPQSRIVAGCTVRSICKVYKYVCTICNSSLTILYVELCSAACFSY